MIVECPRCNARYRVEDEVLQDDPTFKCSRCGHLFAYEAAASEPAPAPESEPEPVAAPAASVAMVETKAAPEPPPAILRPAGGNGSSTVAAAPEPPPPSPPKPAPPISRPRAESLSFSFERRSEPPPRPGRPPAAHVEPDLTPDDADLDFDDDAGEVEDDHAVEEDRGFHDDVPRFVRGEDDLRVEPEPGPRPERAFFAFVALLVIVWGNVGLWLGNHPAEAERWLAGMPLVGGTLTEDRLLQMKIHLEDVQGVYQQIKDDRTVFIVSGRAVNASDQPLRGVQIESGLYDGGGRAVELKSIFCGNVLSRKIVRDLSSKEISLLQQLAPPQRFEVRPGEGVGFSVVFTNPPPSLSEFSARVVAAQRVA